MLTKEEQEALAKLSPEDLAKLLALIQEARALYGTKGGMEMSASVVKAMTDVVDDKLMRSIVEDLKDGRSAPGWLPSAPAKGPEDRRGPVKAIPLGSPPGIKWVDQLVDVADALDKRDLEKRLRGD